MQYEFLSTEPRIANLLQEWVEADAAGARLSWAFRTYYRLRPWVPLAVRHLLQRSRPVEVTPDWFLPREFRAQLATTIGELEAQPLIHPWPDGAQWSLVLTHDVESADGLRNVLRLADMEEEFGFRSAWNIVPYLYPVDWGIVRELRAHGFEIGVHGYNHDGRLFESQATFSRRAVAINRALEAFVLRWFIAISPGCSSLMWNTTRRRSTLIRSRPCRAAWEAFGRLWWAVSLSCPTRCRRTTRCWSC
jgi:hypothetical protein